MGECEGLTHDHLRHRPQATQTLWRIHALLPYQDNMNIPHLPELDEIVGVMLAEKVYFALMDITKGDSKASTDLLAYFNLPPEGEDFDDVVIWDDQEKVATLSYRINVEWAQ